MITKHPVTDNMRVAALSALLEVSDLYIHCAYEPGEWPEYEVVENEGTVYWLVLTEREADDLATELADGYASSPWSDVDRWYLLEATPRKEWISSDGNEYEQNGLLLYRVGESKHA